MKKTEERLKNTMERQVPDVLDAILTRCNTERIGTTMEKKITKRNSSLVKKVTAIAAAVALVLTAGIIAYNANWFGNKNATITNSVEAVVAFDVNPSLEIEIDKNETVLKVNCLNDDAQRVVGDMKLESVQLDVAVNAIIGSMLKNGYLSVDRNSILVSVKSENSEKAELLQRSISADITAMLAAGDIEASVLTQKYDSDENGKADENKISAAKASFIEKILAAGLKDASGNAYTYERLAEMSVNELQLVLDSKNVELENVGISGNASAEKYITAEKALEIALTNAGISADYKSKVEMDFDDGMMLYEVDILHGGYEYEYEINAETGVIIDTEKEKSDKVDLPDSGANSGTTVDGDNETVYNKEGALQIALSYAGVSEADITALRTKLDTEDGVSHYDIEFIADGIEYEYEINIRTGEIIDFEKELHEGNKNDSVSVPENVISEEAAIAKAASHAGVDVSNATVKCKLDSDDGRVHYDVEFKLNGIEYEYEIDAVSGEILKAEQDKESGTNNSTAAKPENLITKEEALAIAYKDAGVSESDVYIIGCELDKENGVWYYEPEFTVGKTEYDYEINAMTGAIINKSVEVENDAPTTGNGTDISASDVIGRDKAISIALGNAGVSESQARELECELDVEKGVTVYEVSFKSQGIEYEYEINAQSGDIIQATKEIDD